MTSHQLSDSDLWDAVHQGLLDVHVSSTRCGALGARTTYRVGGTAEIVVEVQSVSDLIAVSRVVAHHGVSQIVIVGNGSNMLVAEHGYNGIALVIGATGSDEIEVLSDGSVRASGHLSLPQLARQSVAAHRCGLEWAVGVPGTVGGAVRMNAGGHGSDMASSLVSVQLFDVVSGTGAEVAVSDLGLRFRGSALGDTHVVVSGLFATSDPTSHHGHSCADELTEIVRWRRENQPGGQNAGSVFVNPGTADRSAGALIDAAGLRGLRHGSAVVTEKHANFIQSDPGGSADDVVTLMCEVQNRVKQVHGIVMRSEIRLVGFDPAIAERFLDADRHDPTLVHAASKLDAIVRNGNLSL